MDKAEVNLFNESAWSRGIDAVKRVKHCKWGNKPWGRKRIVKNSRGVGRGFRNHRSRRGGRSTDLGEEERTAFNYGTGK